MQTLQSLNKTASAIALSTAIALGLPACSQAQEDPAPDVVIETVDENTDARGASESAALEAPADRAKVTEGVESDVMDNAQGEVESSRTEILQDAVEAIEHTEKALTALDEGNRQTAIDELALATGKLDIVLAREPDLAFAPVDVTTRVQDTLFDVEAVRDLREEIEDLVDEKDYQAARALMETFGSELVIRTYELPLATYPPALQSAAALIDDEAIDAAKAVLDTALNTIVVTDRYIALPLLRAQAMLDEAEGIIAGDIEVEGDRSERLTSLQENAAYQVQLAKAFGYGDKDLYRELEDGLEDLEERIEAGGSTGGLFDAIRRQIGLLQDGKEESDG